MYFIKVLVHKTLFIIFCWLLYFYYLDSNIIVTLLTALQAYVASYFISCWIIQFIFKCFFAQVKAENRCVLITGFVQFYRRVPVEYFIASRLMHRSWFTAFIYDDDSVTLSLSPVNPQYKSTNQITVVTCSLHNIKSDMEVPDCIIKYRQNESCDSGFGHQSALLLNKSGFKVFATCMEPNGSGAKNLIELAEHPKNMIIIEMDVTKDKDIQCAYETVQSSMSYSESLFGLVNNAGIAISCEFEYGPDLQDCKRIMDVNLMGMIKVTRQFLPLVRQAKGRIINIESLAGLMPTPQAIFYGISKFGAAGFSDNLRIGMYRFGVSVISINPFFYKTPLTNTKLLMKCYENSFRNSSEEVRKAYGEKFVQKVKISMMSAKLATTSSAAVPHAIVSALTVYEPNPRYIIAPMIFQPLIKAMLRMPRESLEVWFQMTSWFLGINKVYPDY